MKLYHYATWSGKTIHLSKLIIPSNNYLTSSSLKLVFLTKNEEWEPSIQSYSLEWYYEKCGSHPETYTELEIPCWKFEVSPIKVTQVKTIKADHEKLWTWMVSDAKAMGSNIDDWYVTDETLIIHKTWQWKTNWKETL